MRYCKTTFQKTKINNKCRDFIIVCFRFNCLGRTNAPLTIKNKGTPAAQKDDKNLFRLGI
jgi:hypothetical protein